MSSRWPMAVWIGALAIAALCVPAHGESTAPPGEEPALPGSGPIERIARGVKDIALSPLEVPATMRRVATEKDVFTGMWAGGLEGIGNGLARLCAGLLEVATFPIPGTTLPFYTKKLGERAEPPLGVPTGVTKP